jgi:hypothetical protein
MRIPSLSGYKYFVSFTDDKTRYTMIYFLRQKDQVLPAFKEYKALVENKLDRKIKALRSDRGGEYIGSEMTVYLAEHGIEHQTTARYSPEQNGVSERLNQTLLGRARAMLHDAGLSKEFWAEAVATAAYLKNLCPTKAIENMTPYEAWHGVKPDLKHLRTFGCAAYMQQPKELRNKLDWTSKRCILIGYELSTTQYRLWCPENRRIYVSRDITFIESEKPARQSNTQESLTLEELEELGEDELPPILDDQSDLDEFDLDHENDLGEHGNDLEAEVPKVGVMNNDLEVEVPKAGVIGAPDSEHEQETEPPSDLAEKQKTPEEPGMVDVPLRKSRRIRRLTQKAEQTQRELALSADFAEIEPETFEEAVNDPVHGNAWKEAIQSELDSLAKNKTFTLIKRLSCPAGRKLVTCKWCFEFKRDVTGKIVRHKARLVARGFS